MLGGRDDCTQGSLDARKEKHGHVERWNFWTQKHLNIAVRMQGRLNTYNHGRFNARTREHGYILKQKRLNAITSDTLQPFESKNVWKQSPLNSGTFEFVDFWTQELLSVDTFELRNGWARIRLSTKTFAAKTIKLKEVSDVKSREHLDAETSKRMNA